MQPFLCFVHIEKAGGITLHNLFHRCFPGYISPHPDIRFGEFFSPEDLRWMQRLAPYRIAGIGGHRMAAFMPYEEALRRPVFYCTFMRDPIRRYMSHINWQTSLMGMNWTMETFTADPEKADYHAYRIAGVRDLDKARDLLANRFNFVGLVERYDESLLLLRQRMGLPDLDIRHEMTNTMGAEQNRFRFEDQPAGMQARIRDHNRIDLELYRFVKEELFPGYVAEYPGDLERDAALLREQNKGYRYPTLPYLKRKATNLLTGRLVQPLILQLKKRP